jgi:cell division protein FtsN
VPKAAVRKAPPAKPAAATQKSGHVAAFTTRDWAGRAAVYILHFSSHQDRAAAASEAARLRAMFGKPTHAVEVDLGSKGIWYRVVVGEFRTADEARAFRAELAAKKTPGMGFVYEMRGGR